MVNLLFSDVFHDHLQVEKKTRSWVIFVFGCALAFKKIVVTFIMDALEEQQNKVVIKYKPTYRLEPLEERKYVVVHFLGGWGLENGRHSCLLSLCSLSLFVFCSKVFGLNYIFLKKNPPSNSSSLLLLLFPSLARASVLSCSPPLFLLLSPCACAHSFYFYFFFPSRRIFCFFFFFLPFLCLVLYKQILSICCQANV